MTAQQIKTFTKSATFYQMLITFICIAAASWVGLYGTNEYYKKTKGEALEKEVAKVEARVQSNHSMHLLEQRHTNEKLDELKDLIKEYYRERRGD
jgi:hypothetical protein